MYVGIYVYSHIHKYNQLSLYCVIRCRFSGQTIWYWMSNCCALPWVLLHFLHSLVTCSALCRVEPKLFIHFGTSIVQLMYRKSHR